MNGTAIRCNYCSQHAPDLCLCGLSVTDPAMLENMHLAREAFERDVATELGDDAVVGSPLYTMGAVNQKWFTFWQFWQTATTTHLRTIASLREENVELLTGRGLRPIYMVESALFRNGWHDITLEQYDQLRNGPSRTRVVFYKVAPATPAPPLA